MVTLANGSQTIAKKIDSTCPLPSLPLNYVLYVLDYPFNMISISKLKRDFNCLIIFSDNSVTLQDRDFNCLITFSDNSVTLQDRSTRRTIDIGRESQGLFHLSLHSSSIDTPLLIHDHLGNPNISKFGKMVTHFSNLSSIECESCQPRKHTRVSFPKCLDQQKKVSFQASPH